MTLVEPYATRLRIALADQRRAAERAEKATDLNEVKSALAAAWGARVMAYHMIQEGERITREAALAHIDERKIA